MKHQEMTTTSNAERRSVIQEPISQPQDAVAATVRTRSGRIVKPPERYVPIEVCEDDFAEDEYDSTDLSDVSSEASFDPEEMTSESDADENGNLDGFVIEDKSDASDECSDVSGASSDDADESDA